MELSAGIINFIHAEGRNKIVFCREPMDGLKFINVGRELSLLIKDAGEDNYQTSINQVLAQTSHNDQIGNYLAIENIGILFEPELHLNLQSIFDEHSKNQTLFVCCEGEFVENKFYFINYLSNINIDLSGLLFYNV